MNISIKKAQGAESVRVNQNSTASLTALADDTRELSEKEYRALLNLVAQFRRIDRKLDRHADLVGLIEDARTLSNREWRRTVKLSKNLRKSDRELAKAQLLEKKMKKQRFEQAHA